MNIIIDCNFIANKSAFVRANTPEYLDTDEDINDFIGHFIQSVNYNIKRYNFVERVIFCFDSPGKNWRYGLEYGDLYKSKRKLSTPRYSRSGFKKALSELQIYLRNEGHLVMSYPEMEGDDLIYVTSNLLYSVGESSVILTGDADMRQLIKSTKEKYLVVFNNQDTKSLMHYVDKRQINEINECVSMEDFFSNDKEKSNKEIIFSRCEEINPVKSLFVKILSGDKSDCIPSCYFYQKGTQQFGFTELRAESVFNKYYNDLTNIKEIIFSNEKLLELGKRIILEVEKECSDVKILKCVEGIKKNMKYIFLDHTQYELEKYHGLESYCIGCLEKEPKNSLIKFTDENC